MKILLLLLVLFIVMKSPTVYSQIITIKESGKKILWIEAESGIISSKKSFIDTQLIGTTTIFHLNKQKDRNQQKIFSLPLNGKIYITSDFGDRYHPTLKKEMLHAGIDLRANYEIVKSIANGIIVQEAYDARAGNYLIIQHGNGIESIYCHLHKFLLKSGDLVFAGESVAISGATGVVTAPHLHFAIKENGKYIDPLALLRAIVRINKTTLP
jgi:murein DD-endopeptidase MepM/ murein hydrolase activator NlpD